MEFFFSISRSPNFNLNRILVQQQHSNTSIRKFEEMDMKTSKSNELLHTQQADDQFIYIYNKIYWSTEAVCDDVVEKKVFFCAAR